MWQWEGYCQNILQEVKCNQLRAAVIKERLGPRGASLE